MNRFKDNHMIANPGEFQRVIFDKHNGNHTYQIIRLDQTEIKALSKVRPLGAEIDDKLNFIYHISNICKSASNQLNALITLKHLLRFDERKVLVNTFLMSNFNYCSHDWIKKNWKRTEKMVNNIIRSKYIFVEYFNFIIFHKNVLASNNIFYH